VDDRFYSAFLPPTVRVCGRTLETFSLWHHFVLSAMGSPVAHGGETINAGQLLAAARICALRYGGRSSSLRPRLWDIWWKRRLLRSEARMRAEAGKLYQWIGAHGSGPFYWRKTRGEGGGESPANGPACLALVCSLMMRGGLSRADAWNTSLGEALWLDAQFAQLEGVPLHFVDEAMVGEAPLDLDEMSEADALAMFERDLPAELVTASFAAWQDNRNRHQEGAADA